MTASANPSPGFDWSPDACATLRRLWANTKLSTAEIGRQMGVSKNAVIGKAGRLGLPSHPSPIIRDGRGRRPGSARIKRAGAVTLGPIASAVVVASPPVAVIISKPARVPIPEPAILGSARIPARNECNWPLEKVGTTWRFCCTPRTGDRIYCRHHRLVSSFGSVRAKQIEALAA